MDHLRTRAVFIPAVLLLFLVVAVPVFAYTVPDCVTVGEFEVCFWGVQDNGDGTHTWTYSVEGTGGSDGVVDSELSHWTLGLGACYDGTISPGNGDTYTTIGSYDADGDSTADVTGTGGVTYTVLLGLDPTTGVDGIKYEDPDPEAVGTGDTQIFQFTTALSDPRVGDVAVATKTGIAEETATIAGPVCAPTAVTLSSASTQSTPRVGRFGVALAAFLTLLPAGIVLHTRLR